MSGEGHWRHPKDAFSGANQSSRSHTENVPAIRNLPASRTTNQHNSAIQEQSTAIGVVDRRAVPKPTLRNGRFEADMDKTSTVGKVLDMANKFENMAPSKSDISSPLFKNSKKGGCVKIAVGNGAPLGGTQLPPPPMASFSGNAFMNRQYKSAKAKPIGFRLEDGGQGSVTKSNKDFDDVGYEESWGRSSPKYSSSATSWNFENEGGHTFNYDQGDLGTSVFFARDSNESGLDDYTNTPKSSARSRPDPASHYIRNTTSQRENNSYGNRPTNNSNTPARAPPESFPDYLQDGTSWEGTEQNIQRTVQNPQHQNRNGRRPNVSEPLQPNYENIYRDHMAGARTRANTQQPYPTGCENSVSDSASPVRYPHLQTRQRNREASNKDLANGHTTGVHYSDKPLHHHGGMISRARPGLEPDIRSGSSASNKSTRGVDYANLGSGGADLSSRNRYRERQVPTTDSGDGNSADPPIPEAPRHEYAYPLPVSSSVFFEDSALSIESNKESHLGILAEIDEEPYLEASVPDTDHEYVQSIESNNDIPVGFLVAGLGDTPYGEEEPHLEAYVPDTDHGKVYLSRQHSWSERQGTAQNLSLKKSVEGAVSSIKNWKPFAKTPGASKGKPPKDKSLKGKTSKGSDQQQVGGFNNERPGYIAKPKPWFDPPTPSRSRRDNQQVADFNNERPDHIVKSKPLVDPSSSPGRHRDDQQVIRFNNEKPGYSQNSKPLAGPSSSSRSRRDNQQVGRAENNTYDYIAALNPFVDPLEALRSGQDNHQVGIIYPNPQNFANTIENHMGPNPHFKQASETSHYPPPDNVNEDEDDTRQAIVPSGYPRFRQPEHGRARSDSNSASGTIGPNIPIDEVTRREYDEIVYGSNIFLQSIPLMRDQKPETFFTLPKPTFRPINSWSNVHPKIRTSPYCMKGEDEIDWLTPAQVASLGFGTLRGPFTVNPHSGLTSAQVHHALGTRGFEPAHPDWVQKYRDMTLSHLLGDYTIVIEQGDLSHLDYLRQLNARRAREQLRLEEESIKQHHEPPPQPRPRPSRYRNHAQRQPRR